MTLYGLIAHPAAHSLSPIMQNEMMIARQINGHYHSFDIKIGRASCRERV